MYVENRGGAAGLTGTEYAAHVDHDGCTLLYGGMLTALVASASPAISQQASPPSEQANQTKALVDKAAALVD